MNAIKKLIPMIIFVLGHNSLISQSIFDTKIQRNERDSKYMIEQNGQLWTVDTTIITVKLKPGIKSLPKNLIALRANKLGFIDLKTPNNIQFLDYVDILKPYAELFEIIEYNTFGEYSVTPNDQRHTNQWYLNHINAFDAWNYTMGSSDVVVAVLDAGLDVNHEDIGNGTDGYNNIAIDGWNFEDNTSDVSSTYFHGTFVAGIISAKTNNGKGISGIGGGNNGYGVKILPIKLGTNAPVAGIIDDAILYAVDKKVRVIQLSLIASQSASIDSAIQYAVNNNVLVVCSAGNNNWMVTYPASNNNVMSVGAINQNNKRADFSNYGGQLDIVAPGNNIYSTNLNSTYNYDAGTSFAAPIVSAVAALILSVNPNLTAKQVRDIIEQTAQKVGGYNYANSIVYPNGPWHEQMGYGLVNAYEAVKRAACMANPVNYISLTGIQPSYKQVICNEINIQNATVPAGTTLILDACNKTTINHGFKVEAGAHFIVR